MEFFIDSADIKEIRSAKELGLINGVTTNPSLVAKTGKSLVAVIEEISAEVDGPISIEVTKLDFEGMIEQAHQFREFSKNIVIKLPLTTEGMKAVAYCSQNNIPTNATLCFNSPQALLAAKAGATYISPFVGRLDDISHSGMDLIKEIKTIYGNYKMDTKILVASIRHNLHLRDAALIGADVATIPYNTLTGLLRHPLTDNGLARFVEDSEKFSFS